MSEPAVHRLALCETDRVGTGSVIEAFASVAGGSTLGVGVVVACGARVLGGAEIGERVRVEVGAVVGSHVCIQAGAVVGARAVLGDSTLDSRQYLGKAVEIGPGAMIGANAVVAPGVRIGRDARVCAGAVVTRSVPANAIVAGNPASITGYVGLADGAEDAMSLAPVREPGVGDPLESSVVAGVSLYRAPLHGDLRGSLVAKEFGRDIPFEPRRTFFVFDVPSAEVRGEHAHRECHQFISCVHGACSPVAEDGQARAEFRLDDPTLGVHIPPMVWCTQYRHTRDAVLLVYASHAYDADDYIRDYEAYIAELGRQR